MRTILVTGGSGSFGRAFIATTLATSDDRILSVSRNAALRYDLEQAHLRHVQSSRLVVLPGDVRSVNDLEPAFDLGPDCVVHAAAEKHVGTGQRYQSYTWGINVGGAHSIIDLAIRYKVGRVLALSTDKACDPVNFYGETKQEAEEEFLAADAEQCGPWFSLVRYGNVVASSGSVVPLFLQQRESGVLTVTDRRMTRFAMPIADPPFCEFPVSYDNGASVMSAVRLVQTALRDMRGGEIFVPRIPSASIQQLAEQIGPDCTIDEIGIRDGEKLHEALISPAEAERTYQRPDGLYVILAPHRGPEADWVRVPAGFSYTSEQTQMIHVTAAVLAA